MIKEIMKQQQWAFKEEEQDQKKMIVVCFWASTVLYLKKNSFQI